MTKVIRVVLALDDGSTVEEEVDGRFAVIRSFEPSGKGKGTTPLKWAKEPFELCQVTWTRQASRTP